MNIIILYKTYIFILTFAFHQLPVDFTLSECFIFLAGCVASQNEDHTMAASNKYLHLTDDERRNIQYGIENNSSKKSIADTLAKTNLQLARKSKINALSLTNPNRLSSALMPENVLTSIRTTVLGTVLPSSHLSIKTYPLSWRIQRLRKIEALAVRQVQV